MFYYPSIFGSLGQAHCEFDARVFGKLDGRNTCWEWTKKRGFHKAGTRGRLFDETDREYGSAIALFRRTLAEPLACVFERRWRGAIVTAFAEYWGDRSLGGVIVLGDEMRLSLIDVAVGNELLDPRDYLRYFVGEVDAAPYLGAHRWTRGFVRDIWEGRVEGMPLEGVVGKGSGGVMRKAKQRAWVDAVRARYTPEEADRIVNS